jgi:UDP-N-acetyl-D-glucosamine dehydrogenase
LAQGDYPGESATLAARIDSRAAMIGICGMGYVGLPLAMAAWDAGFSVLAFDTDPEKIVKLAAGEPYLRHIAPDKLTAMAADARFAATGEFDRLAECDVIAMCVPTPLGPHGEPDLSYVERTSKPLRRGSAGQLVILESTTYPARHRRSWRASSASGRAGAGHGLFCRLLARARGPGNADFTTRQVPKVVGGMGRRR